MATKRILYLTNHVTLTKFEIPMLQSFGYELYMPKVPDFDISCTVDWALDKTLTIPQEDLNILNQTDFYYTPITEQVSRIINKYFGIVFTVSYPAVFESMVRHFEGAVVFRAYGNGLSYTSAFESLMGTPILTQIESLGDRFWFGSGYETIPMIEGRLLKGRDVFLPLGMPNAIVNDRWIGTGNRVLFPCPKINMIPYFNDVYKTFKKDFKDIPYAVCGVQPIPVDDPNVLGYLSDEEYARTYSMSSCMYYYSQVKTHIHYTPAEAVKWGLPLVFMAGGLLDNLGGIDQPGRCESIKEARNKVKRLVSGDKRLAEDIRKKQPRILDKFSYDYCEPIWRKSLQMIELGQECSRSEIKLSSKKKRIAIIVPNIDDINSLNNAICLLKVMRYGKISEKEDLDIVFSYAGNLMDRDNYIISYVKSIGVQIRQFKWEDASVERIKAIYKIKDYAPYGGFKEKYSILNDGMAYFHDCDFLLFTSTDVPREVFTEKPYAILVRELYARFINREIDCYTANASIAFIRNAQECFVTSPLMKEHVVQYAGILEHKVTLIPFLIDNEPLESVGLSMNQCKKNYIMWEINGQESPRLVVGSLQNYYVKGGKDKVVLVYSGKVDVEQYKCELSDLIDRYPHIKHYIKVYNKPTRLEFFSLLKGATCLISSSRGDGGDMNCVYASLFDTKIISNDSPTARYVAETFGLEVQFCELYEGIEIKDLMLKKKQNSEDEKLEKPNYKKWLVNSSDVYLPLFKLIKFKCCL